MHAMSLNRWQRTLIFPATFYRLQPSIAAMAKVPNCSLDGIFLPTSVAPGLSLQLIHLPGPDPDDTTLLRFIHVSSFPLFPDWLCVCVPTSARALRPSSEYTASAINVMPVVGAAGPATPASSPPRPDSRFSRVDTPLYGRS